MHKSHSDDGRINFLSRADVRSFSTTDQRLPGVRCVVFLLAEPLRYIAVSIFDRHLPDCP